ncbi:MAG: sialidase family protein [Gemmataceae bacterium]
MPHSLRDTAASVHHRRTPPRFSHRRAVPGRAGPSVVSAKVGAPLQDDVDLALQPAAVLAALAHRQQVAVGCDQQRRDAVSRVILLPKTWSKLEVVASDGDNTLGIPCLLTDRKTGTIWMGLTRSLGSDTKERIVAGASKERTRVLVISSKDSGKT